jgi:hypothetical protein
VYLLLKALVSGLLIALASEAARRSSLLGAVLISLPLTSILAITWLWIDTRDAGQVQDLSWSILWVILPSVTFFVVLPLAIRAGLAVVPSLVVACIATGLAYAAWVWLAGRIGLEL